MVGLTALMVFSSILLLATGIWRLWTGAMAGWQQRRRVSWQRVRPEAGPADSARHLRILRSLMAAGIGGGLLFALFYAMSGRPGLAFGGALGGLLVPAWWGEWQRTRHMVAVSEQLDQAMGLIASALRRGVPLEVAFSQAAAGVGPPLGEVLGQVGAGASVGLSFGQSLTGVRRHPAVAEHPDFQVFVTQVSIAHERGANILQTFEALRDAIAARRRYRASVSEQMGQHLVQSVTIMAVGLLVLMGYAFMTPQGLRPLLETGLGRILLLLSILGNLALLRWNHVSMLRQLRRV